MVPDSRRPGFVPCVAMSTEKPENPAATANEVMTVAEAAHTLRVNEKTLRAAIARNEVPGVRRFGRVIRLSRTALLEWLRGKSAT